MESMVTRRTFGKSLASLLMVPLLKMQTETIDRHKLLAIFLDDGQWSHRYDFKRPYVIDSFAYGTDGRAMARITTSEDEHDDETIRLPPIKSAWESHYQPDTAWQPFQIYDVNDLLPSQSRYGGICPVCFGGRIQIKQDWNDINAKDWVRYDCDPDDNTMNDINCPQCKGESFYAGPSLQPVGDVKIGYEYAKTLAAMPGCEVAINHSKSNFGYPKDHAPFDVLLFRSEAGIAGVVCCVNDLKNRG
jgi:hypothetical protein